MSNSINKEYIDSWPNDTEDLLWGDGDWDKNPITDTLKDLVREHGAVKVQEAMDETTAGAFLDYCGTDAMRWAEQYAGMHGGDVGLLVGWFANAIEAGRNAHIQATVSLDQWLDDVNTLMTAWMYGNPPGGWSDPTRRENFMRDVADVERRMYEAHRVLRETQE